MIKKTGKLSLIITAALAVISFFVEGWLFAFNIFAGGSISLLSFRAIVWAVRKFLGNQMAQAAIMGISVIKITAIFIFLVILAYFSLLLPVPFLAGFTLVLAIIIWQGIVLAGKVPAE
jgi:hypothetical protein